MSNHDYNNPLVVEPRREVVEITDDGGGMIIVAEPVPTYSGTATIDTTGTEPADVLIAGPDGVLRPRSAAEVVEQYQRGSAVHYVDSLDDVPSDVHVGEWVTVINGPDYGAVYRMEE